MQNLHDGHDVAKCGLVGMRGHGKYEVVIGKFVGGDLGIAKRLIETMLVVLVDPAEFITAPGAHRCLPRPQDLE